MHKLNQGLTHSIKLTEVSCNVWTFLTEFGPDFKSNWWGVHTTCLMYTCLHSADSCPARRLPSFLLDWTGLYSCTNFIINKLPVQNYQYACTGHTVKVAKFCLHISLLNSVLWCFLYACYTTICGECFLYAVKIHKNDGFHEAQRFAIAQYFSMRPHDTRVNPSSL